jgi:hypothetical protein
MVGGDETSSLLRDNGKEFSATHGAEAAAPRGCFPFGEAVANGALGLSPNQRNRFGEGVVYHM